MYGDFECPYCAAAQSILARVRTRLGDDLRFAFRHLPLGVRAPARPHAAEAAEAAAAQGAFWEMHDALYAGRGRLEDRDLVAHARGARARRRPRRRRAGRRHAHAERVARDAESAAPAPGSAPRRPSSSTASATPDAYDAGSLVTALRG